MLLLIEVALHQFYGPKGRSFGISTDGTTDSPHRRLTHSCYDKESVMTNEATRFPHYRTARNHLQSRTPVGDRETLEWQCRGLRMGDCSLGVLPVSFLLGLSQKGECQWTRWDLQFQEHPYEHRSEIYRVSTERYRDPNGDRQLGLGVNGRSTQILHLIELGKRTRQSVLVHHGRNNGLGLKSPSY